MKIALIGQTFDQVAPPRQNSLGIWTYQVARRLAAEHEVFVYTSENDRAARKNPPEPFHYRFSRLTTSKRLRKFSRRISDWLGNSAQRRVVGFDLHGFLYILFVALDLRKTGCDLAHLHNYSQYAPVLRFFNPRLRIVLHMHCEWLTQLDRKLIAGRLEKVDLVLGVSEYITEKIRRRFPEFANRCVTVHNGVDAARFAPRPGSSAQSGDPAIRLLFVGRVSPEKGVHDLLDAFALVAREIPGARLRLAGSTGALPKEFIVTVSEDAQVLGLESYYQGSYYERLQQRIPPSIKEQVAFTGFVPYPEVPSLYQQADVLVNPSYSESFGLSLVEAMACGIPVVATRAGGMAEIVEHGKTGFLVERGQPEALAEALLDLSANPELRRMMGEAGRQRVLEYFTWDRTAQALAACYAELLQPLRQGVAAR